MPHLQSGNSFPKQAAVSDPEPSSKLLAMLCWSTDLFSNAIRRGRDTYGYSLGQVAEYLMMPPERIEALEAGTAEPHPQEIHNFETLYGLSFVSRAAA